MKTWGQLGIELRNPGPAIRLSNNCATGPGCPVLDRVSLIKQCRSAFSLAYLLGSVFCHTSVVIAGHLFRQCALFMY